MKEEKWFPFTLSISTFIHVQIKSVELQTTRKTAILGFRMRQYTSLLCIIYKIVSVLITKFLSLRYLLSLILVMIDKVLFLD